MAEHHEVALSGEALEELRRQSDATGLSISELVRRSLDPAFFERARAALEESFDAWKDRTDAEVAELMKRPPGTGGTHAPLRALIRMAPTH